MNEIYDKSLFGSISYACSDNPTYFVYQCVFIFCLLIMFKY